LPVYDSFLVLSKSLAIKAKKANIITAKITKKIIIGPKTTAFSI
jgi:hypothetical protein